MFPDAGIYKILNKIDGKIYVGSSIHLSNRKTKHFWMLNKNKHDNQHLQNAFNKFGEENFSFEVIEICSETDLVIKENFHIQRLKSNNFEFGYNLATVTETRRNNFNEEVKIKLSKYNLSKNNNFTKYSLTNIISNEIHIFDNLVDGANFLIKNGFSKGNPKHVRMKISFCLRNIPLNNGSSKSIRKTCYGHKFNIINN